MVWGSLRKILIGGGIRIWDEGSHEEYFEAMDSEKEECLTNV